MITNSGASGSLGALFVTLGADPTGLAAGMRQAEQLVAGGTLSMTRVLTAFEVSVSLILAESVREFAKFNQAMTQSVAIVKDLNEVTKTAMEDTARQLATNGVQSAAQLAKGYYFLESAGLSAAQSIKALPVAANFATAGVFDLSKAVETLTQSQSALGLKMKDPIQNMENMSRLADILTRAQSIAQGTTLEFAEALSNRAAAAMRTFGITVENGVAVLAAFADQGVKGNKAGQDFAIVLRDLQKAALANMYEFQRMGISVFDNEGKIRNLADVVQDLEKALGSMSAEEKKYELQKLGFQDRSLNYILMLIGTSKAIREYEASLKSAGGATEQVANKQLQSFISQLTITWHRIQDMLITIGEGIAGPLASFNKTLQDLTTRNAQFTKDLKVLSEFLGEAFVTVLMSVADIFKLWKMGMDVMGIAFLTLADLAIKAFKVVANVVQTVMDGVINAVIGGVNVAIGGVNMLISKLPKSVTDTLGIGGLSKISPFERQGSLVTELEGMQKTVEALWDKLLEDLKKSAFGIENQGATVVNVTKKAVEAFNAEAEALKNLNAISIAASISMEKLLDKMQAPSGKDFTGRFVGMTKTEMSLGSLSVGPSPNQEVLQMLQAQKALEDNNLKLKRIEEERLAQMKANGGKEVQLTAEIEKRKQDAIKLYLAQNKQLRIQETELALQTTSKMFDDLGSIAKIWGGEQSELYTAMFAASKAFAIADATVKIFQGIANAASLPWPLNLAAIGQVVAATATIVSSISAVTLQIAGKKERGGPVGANQAYLVGERGPEIFVPSASGNIVPNDRIGGGSTKIVVNNYTEAVPSVTERQVGDEKVIEVMVRRVKNEIGSEVRDGRGPVNRAIEQTFKLRRGQ